MSGNYDTLRLLQHRMHQPAFDWIELRVGNSLTTTAHARASVACQP